jgi:hypothetical protein
VMLLRCRVAAKAGNRTALAFVVMPSVTSLKSHLLAETF